MKVIKIRNVHRALPEAIYTMETAYMNGEAVKRLSRAGKVVQMKDPVTTVFEKPTERVLFWPDRDANPFFHFMESLWMLSGRNDVRWISKYNKSFRKFSDDGKTFHGAYGTRWRHWFEPYGQEDNDAISPIDQIFVIAQILRNNPNDRRCVLQMWDATTDLARNGKDFPCNIAALFAINAEEALDMTVFNRSNDIIWGAYGANAVHFSMLQEVMAAAIDVKIGRYWQVSNNWHAYEETYNPLIHLFDRADNGRGSSERTDPYTTGEVSPFPVVNGSLATWFEDLAMFIDEGPIVGFRDVFFRRVATPIFWAWEAKEVTEDPERFDKALEILQQCAATDWQKACSEWLLRRRQKAQESE